MLLINLTSEILFYYNSSFYLDLSIIHYQKITTENNNGIYSQISIYGNKFQDTDSFKKLVPENCASPLEIDTYISNNMLNLKLYTSQYKTTSQSKEDNYKHQYMFLSSTLLTVLLNLELRSKLLQQQGVLIQHETQYSSPITYTANIQTLEITQYKFSGYKNFFQVVIDVDETVQYVQIQYATFPQILAQCNSAIALMMYLGFLGRQMAQRLIKQELFILILKSFYQETYQKILRLNNIQQFKDIYPKNNTFMQNKNKNEKLVEGYTDPIFIPSFETKKGDFIFSLQNTDLNPKNVIQKDAFCCSDQKKVKTAQRQALKRYQFQNQSIQNDQITIQFTSPKNDDSQRISFNKKSLITDYYQEQNPINQSNQKVSGNQEGVIQKVKERINSLSNSLTSKKFEEVLFKLKGYALFLNNQIQPHNQVFLKQQLESNQALMKSSRFYNQQQNQQGKRLLGMCNEGCKYCILNRCLTGQCKNGYYSNNNILDTQCFKCDQSCLECNGSGNNKCTSCQDTFQLQNGQCIQCKLNNGEYYDQGMKNCQPCSKNCLSCSDKDTCTQCVNNFQLTDKICSQSCPYQNQFKDQTTDTCQYCDSTCQTCVNSPTTCTSCLSNQYLNTQNSICQIQCDQPGFFIQQNSCMPCDSSCLTCTGTSKYCTQCRPHQFLDVQAATCLDSCPVDGFYVSGQTCMPCDSSCSTCSGPLQTQCDLCAVNLFQYGDDKVCKACPNSSIDPSAIALKMQYCSQIVQKCLLNSQTNKYELAAICYQCQSSYVLSNNNCVNTCSEVALNYSYNQALGYCQCIPSSPYQHNQPNDKILCSSFQLSGYYCDSNKICNPCQQSNCQICSNQQICTSCNQGYYLWQNSCINTCESNLGLEISQSNKECVCKQNYLFYALKQMCILQLQINSIKLTKDPQYNVITVVFNRAPYPDELKTISMQIDPSNLVQNTDYTIVSQEQNDKNLVFQVSVQQNIKISQIFINYNNKQALYKVQNTILTSEQTNYQLQSKQGAINNMNSLGQSLSPQEGATQTIVNILKNFQILCLLSNFVQLLGPLIVFKDDLPQPLYVGVLLGSSFIFTEIPDSDELSASLIDSQNKNQEQSSQQSLLEHLGFNENIYNNLPIPHLLLIVSVLISLLCLFARWAMKGKQYTMVIVNVLVNTMSSLQQGYMTCSLFSIFYSLEYSSQRQFALIQLGIHIIFLILICALIFKKDMQYIQNNIPNFILNLNIKSRGWKSYLIMSYLKKYICITIIYAFQSNPMACSIVISIIFFCFASYLLYFRFFTSKICNIYKIFQELVISITFILFTISVKKQQQMMQQYIISNEEFISTMNFSLIVLYFIISCLAISFFIFIARTGQQIFIIVQKIRKYFVEKRNYKITSQELDSLLNQITTQKKQNFELPVIKIKLGSTYVNKISSNINSVKNDMHNQHFKEEIA
ncbi:hypothetical protein ABPG72_009215 [Tetrahymena utriculariae]